MDPQPGQFYMVQVDQNYDPLLKRPFCIFNSESQEISFLVRTVGRGTSILNNKLPGNIVGVIGPLGRPYPIIDKRPLIVAGGMGIASLYSLIKRFSHTARIIYGVESRNSLVFVNEIRSLIRDALFVTDDGSFGEQGNVMDFIGRFADPPHNTVVYSCGPEIMLKKVSEYCKHNSIECYISLEQDMACGIGSCLGCVVKTVHGYQRVCKEGPVFNAKEILWE